MNAIKIEMLNTCKGIRADLERLYNLTDEEREELEERGECASLYDYIIGALDIDLIIGIDGSLRGAEITVAYGGPGIYIDTRRGYIKGAWGGERVEYPLGDEICDALNDELSYIAETISIK